MASVDVALRSAAGVDAVVELTVDSSGKSAAELRIMGMLKEMTRRGSHRTTYSFKS